MCKSNVDMDVVDVMIEDGHTAPADVSGLSSTQPLRGGAVVIPMDA